MTKQIISLDIDGVLLNLYKVVNLILYSFLNKHNIPKHEFFDVRLHSLDKLFKYLAKYLSKDELEQFKDALFKTAISNTHWIDILERYSPYFKFVIVTNRENKNKTENHIRHFLKYIDKIYYKDSVDPHKILRLKNVKPICHIDDNVTILKMIKDTLPEVKPVVYLGEPFLVKRKRALKDYFGNVVDKNNLDSFFRSLL